MDANKNENTTGSRNRENANDSEWPTEDLLSEISNAESALTESSRQNTEVVNKHIHDNHWNWR